MDISLLGKNALVCGSSRGIGKATAIVLSQQGANVTLVARSEDKLSAVLKRIGYIARTKSRLLGCGFFKSS